MKIKLHHRQEGIALVIVMIAVMVLSMLAATFALQMKVETKLAQNADSEVELMWLGRSGVELARYVLAQQTTVPNEPYDALNQKWAGGPGGAGTSNSVLSTVSLDDYKLGNGSFSVKIVDLERKVNINIAGQEAIEQALTLVGVDTGAIPSISGAILDWIDADDDTHINGAESDYYQGLNPPYYAKNAPIDDMSEMLLISGITPDIYWGGVSSNHPPASFQSKFGSTFNSMLGSMNQSQAAYPYGLVEFFTPLSSGRLNINTASASALQMIPGVDETVAAAIIQVRAGPDGADGTDDDTPYQNAGELMNVPGITRDMVASMQRVADVRSRTFEVTVDAQVGGYHRKFMAVLLRNSGTDVQILSFHWK